VHLDETQVLKGQPYKDKSDKIKNWSESLLQLVSKKNSLVKVGRIRSLVMEWN
jgi:hypothetical protein